MARFGYRLLSLQAKEVDYLDPLPLEMMIGVCLLLGTVFGRIGVPDDKLAPILSAGGTR